ncbi:MAG: hypothetical protein K8T10_18460 [Candidatus Eremiobacteraeota bacterium]|nr:hypothetical protein [Candidatus Eremiobacteraeota bacterium]
MKRAPSNYITITLMIIVFVFSIQTGKMADVSEGKPLSLVFVSDIPDKNDEVDEDEDDRDTMVQGKSQKKGGEKKPVQYLPVDPNVKKLKLKAMDLARKFTKILAERSKLQPELAKLESNEAELRYLRLKYQIEYLKKRDQLMEKYPGNKKIMDMLRRHDGVISHINDLIFREEKIDCYHTIYERKHRAMEEYHWNILDNKHPLVAEYLQDRSWKKNKEEIKELYGDIVIDYIRIIKENTKILKKTKQIIKEKKKREKIMRKIVDEWKKLYDELKKYKGNSLIPGNMGISHTFFERVNK